MAEFSRSCDWWRPEVRPPQCDWTHETTFLTLSHTPALSDVPSSESSRL